MQMPPSPGINSSGNNTDRLCEREAERGISHTQAPRNAQQASAEETPGGHTQTFPITPDHTVKKSSSESGFCTHTLAAKLSWHSCIPWALTPEPMVTSVMLPPLSTTAKHLPSTASSCANQQLSKSTPSVHRLQLAGSSELEGRAPFRPGSKPSEVRALAAQLLLTYIKFLLLAPLRRSNSTAIKRCNL